MHFLKCKNCGHLNEVKSEYLTFCSICNKKLDNNFSGWKKSNPDKSLEDFKQLICISDEEIQKSNSEKKLKKPKKFKYWIVFVAVFVVVFSFSYVIAYFGVETIVKYIKSEKTSKDVLDKKWTREAYGDYGLSIETPAKLVKSEMPLPDNIKQYIDNMDYYEYVSEKGFKIIINSAKYNPAVGETNLQGAANGSIQEMKNESGVTDFTYDEEYISKDDIPGFIQNGTFRISGVDVEFINTGFASGLIFWQVMVVFQSDDDVGRIAAKRVIGSIEINH